MVNLQVFKGLTIADAAVLANVMGLEYRVKAVDGAYNVMTMDYRPRRLNFIVEGGKITSVNLG